MPTTRETRKISEKVLAQSVRLEEVEKYEKVLK